MVAPNYDGAVLGGTDIRQGRFNLESSQADFHTLSVRPDIQIKVAERLRRLFRREISLEWDAGNLKVMFQRTSRPDTVYSSAREASGLLHLVANLSALYDNDVGALFLDEPEISLLELPRLGGQ